MTKKVLITGGSGFIARSLYEHFSNSYFSPLEKNIYCLGRQELDLLDTKKVFNFIKKHDFDVVIHSATYDAVPEFTVKDSNRVLENNLKMFFNISRCKDYFGKMIYFGSGAEAGRDNWAPQMTEEYIEKQVPKDQYAYSKFVMNEHTNLSENIYNLRLFGLFGKFDDWRYRFISNACCKAILGRPIVIKQNIFFDYLYIRDFTQIVQWFIENTPEHKSYNICTGKSHDYGTLARKIAKISNKSIEILLKNTEMRKEYSGDNTRLQSELQHQFTDIDASIKELYGWYEKNKGIIRKDCFVY